MQRFKIADDAKGPLTVESVRLPGEFSLALYWDGKRRQDLKLFVRPYDILIDGRTGAALIGCAAPFWLPPTWWLLHGGDEFCSCADLEFRRQYFGARAGVSP